MSYEHHKDAEKRRKSAYDLIRGLLEMDLYPAHKREFLGLALWKVTEAEPTGKFRTRYCTEKALAAQKEDLQHEHVHERKKIVDALLKDPQDLECILEQAIACTVTKAEHEQLTKLSKQRPDLEGWDRYRAAAIPVIDTATGERFV